MKTFGSDNKLTYIANYIDTTKSEIACIERDLRLSQMITLEYLEKAQIKNLEQINDRLSETFLLIKIILPLSLAIKNGNLQLSDLKKLNLSDRLYIALSELSYFPKFLHESTTKELMEIIQELFYRS